MKDKDDFKKNDWVMITSLCNGDGVFTHHEIGAKIYVKVLCNFIDFFTIVHENGDGYNQLKSQFETCSNIQNLPPDTGCPSGLSVLFSYKKPKEVPFMVRVKHFFGAYKLHKHLADEIERRRDEGT